MKRYIIVQATCVRMIGAEYGHSSGYSCSAQVPTFFLDAQVQGIVNLEQAEGIAKSVIDPHGVHEVHVSVAWCED